MRAGLFAVVLALMPIGGLSAAEKLIWLDISFPPYSFAGAPESGEGYCDGGMMTAIDSMPDYDHKVRQMQFARFLKLLKTKPNYCYSCLFKTAEREEFMVFSKPYAYSESIMVIARARDADRYRPFLDASGKLDLAAMMGAGLATVSVIHGRSYGTLIDSVLASYRETEAIATLSSSTSLELQVRRLISLEAYDIILGYPAELGWHMREQGIAQDTLVIYPIQGLETFDPISYTYFGCSKSDQGRAAIDAIDAQIDTIRDTAFAKHRVWLEPQIRALHEAHEPVFRGENP